MIRISTDTDIGMNRNIFDWLGMNFQSDTYARVALTWLTRFRNTFKSLISLDLIKSNDFVEGIVKYCFHLT